MVLKTSWNHSKNHYMSSTSKNKCPQTYKAEKYYNIYIKHAYFDSHVCQDLFISPRAIVGAEKHGGRPFR
jgi:hypothetical protein